MVICIFFNLVYSIWENRNAVLHGPDHRWKVTKRTMWNKSIQFFFDKNKYQEWKKEDRRLFLKGSKRIPRYIDEDKQQWLESKGTPISDTLIY
jgi:hypothetical protein